MHSGAGVPTVVHGLPGAGDLRLRVAGGGEERFVSDDVHRFGAARRPSGGIVIVTHHYFTDALALQLVPEAYDAPVVRVDLATVEVQGSMRLPIVVTDDEHAHFVVATSSSSLSYFDVDLAGGFRREDFEI